jgi:hypothetical protein
MFVIDTDFGCGIIKPKYNSIVIKDKLISIDYPYFDRNRESLLNLINVDQFKQWLKK